MKTITVLNDTDKEFDFQGYLIQPQSFKDFYENDGMIIPVDAANAIAHYYASSSPKEILRVSEKDNN